MKYKKYFRKTSLKQNGVGDFFLSEIYQKKPKIFLEVGVFHGVTARNVCELLYSIHGDNFKYIGLDLFHESDENKDEIIPNTKFKNPLKNIYFNYIKRQNPYSIEAVEDLLKKFKNNVSLIKGNAINTIPKFIKDNPHLLISLLFLDFDLYEPTKIALTHFLPRMPKGAIVAFDELDNPLWPGETKAMLEFFEEKKLLTEIKIFKLPTFPISSSLFKMDKSFIM